MTLLFDVETNGKIQDYKAPPAFHNRYPFIIDIAWMLVEGTVIVEQKSYLIRPEGWEIPNEPGSFWDEHGYDTRTNTEHGVPMFHALKEFEESLYESSRQIAHNIHFDRKIIQANFHRYVQGGLLMFKNPVCSMQAGRAVCDARDKNGRRKAPRLEELYLSLTGKEIVNKHRAKGDVDALYECYVELLKRNILS